MTIDQLRHALRDLPGQASVYITFPDDEASPLCLTYDATHRVFRLCKDSSDIGVTEKVVEDFSPASGQFGVGA